MMYGVNSSGDDNGCFEMKIEDEWFKQEGPSLLNPPETAAAVVFGTLLDETAVCKLAQAMQSAGVTTVLDCIGL